MMKLWLLSQTENCDYDTFDALVVAAPSASAAKRIHPCPQCSNTWVTQKHVMVKYIGTAAPDTKEGIILSSFRAG
jgi:hypothetical protein